MKKFGLVLLVTALACAQTDISGERMRAHVKFLASDLLEGRGVGTRGGELATEYIASQFALAGAKPAGENGTYFQRVPMVGVTTSANATLAAVGAESNRLVQMAGRFRRRQRIAAARPISSTPKRSSSDTALSRPNFTGTISRAWT